MKLLYIHFTIFSLFIIPTGALKSPSVEGLKKAAEYLRQGLNETADPCQDFFAFTCGKYFEDHPVSPNTGTAILEEIKDMITADIMKYLNDKQAQGATAAIKKLKTFYDSCVDRKLNEFQKSFKEDYNKLTSKLELLLAKLYKSHYINVFLAIHVFHVNRTNTLFLFPGFQTFTPFKPELYDEYKKRIVKYLKNIKNIINVEKDPDEYADLILNIEGKLGNFTFKKFEPLMYSDLIEKFPDFDWKSYFDELNITNRSTLFHVAMDYFKQLEAYFNSFQGNDRSNIVDYIKWCYIYKYYHMVSEEKEDPTFKTLTLEEVFSSRPEDPRKSRCANIVSRSMLHATSRLFIENKFEHLDERVSDMKVETAKLFVSFQQIIKNNKWLDWKDKNEIITKIQRMAKNIGYPKWILNDDKLNNYYDNLAITRSGFWRKMIDANELSVYHNLQKRFQTSSQYDLTLPPLTANAQYSPFVNSINVPLGISLEPFYGLDFPKSINFASLGSIIGHESGHGFDTNGIKYNWNGTMTAWLSPYVERELFRKANCLIKEYNTKCCFYLKTKNKTVCVNGNHTVPENMADLTGTTTAYNSYIKYIKNNGNELSLPGLEKYNNKQIFWISYGYHFCENVGDNAREMQLLFKGHSPAKCRVNQVIQNIPQFGQDFNCNLAAPMYPYPRDRCNVW